MRFPPFLYISLIGNGIGVVKHVQQDPRRFASHLSSKLTPIIMQAPWFLGAGRGRCAYRLLACLYLMLFSYQQETNKGEGKMEERNKGKINRAKGKGKDRGLHDQLPFSAALQSIFSSSFLPDRR